MKTVWNRSVDVVVVGAGPAGLGAATRLRQAGVERVLVVERQAEGGGATRHCGHRFFGLLEHGRLVDGASYAHRLVAEAEKTGVEILYRASVLELKKTPSLIVATPDGPGEISAKKVLLATGTHEATRGARFVSGDRMAGICTTGTLQSMYYLKEMLPFTRPVIVGTEIVSFSALLTCRKAGIDPVAMVALKNSSGLPWPLSHFGRLKGVPLFAGIEKIRICGKARVETLCLQEKEGCEIRLACDGVLFTGGFQPDAAVARMSHLAIDHKSCAPAVDAFGRCSDPAFFAAGNLLMPVKPALSCWRRGRRIAEFIARDLQKNPVTS